MLITNQFFNILENDISNKSLLVILSGLLELRRSKQTMNLALINHCRSSRLLLLLLLDHGIILDHRSWLLLHLHHRLRCWHSASVCVSITILVAILNWTGTTILTLVVVLAEITIVLVLPALVLRITISLILILILMLNLIHIRSCTIVVVVHLIAIVSIIRVTSHLVPVTIALILLKNRREEHTHRPNELISVGRHLFLK